MKVEMEILARRGCKSNTLSPFRHLTDAIQESVRRDQQRRTAHPVFLPSSKL